MSQPDPFLPAPTAEEPPPPAAPAAAAPGGHPLARKTELEAAMAAAPRDAGLRAAYFEHLGRLASTQTGLFWALLPEIGAPLWFRGGTPDIAALAAAFRDNAYAVPDLRATPQRILVIGAHAGYSALALARLHPRAVLLCAEPLADNLRLLALNTTPCRRIRVAQTALWHSATRLAPTGRLQADWMVRLTDEALDADRVIPAMSVPELLARAGWTHADMVFCDASGSEREIFIDPLAPWLQRLDVAVVRTYDPLATQASELVAACFAGDSFSHRTHGALQVHERRTPLTALPRLPAEVFLLRAEPGGAPFGLQDVASQGWAFFVFDGSSCQLHPNGPGEAPARAIFPVRLDGHARFVSLVRHAGNPTSPAVVFTARLARMDGTVVAQGTATVSGHGSDRIAFDLPAGLQGPMLAVLETAMAADAPSNAMAWARWIDPRLS
ncbi:MAG TPA: hypothetical protein VFN42_07100 [Acetobacteraceae bacterium]|nr:hypothetical protein [Acetobacteraceae bacterium]